MGQEDDICVRCVVILTKHEYQNRPCDCHAKLCEKCLEWCLSPEGKGCCDACNLPIAREAILNCLANIKEGKETEKEIEEGFRKRANSKLEIPYEEPFISVEIPNLVFIAGYPLAGRTEEFLKNKEGFGKFGKVKTAAYKYNISKDPNAGKTANLYITFSKSEEAAAAVKEYDQFVMQGCKIRAKLGETKYCRKLVNNLKCQEINCKYAHEWRGNDEQKVKLYKRRESEKKILHTAVPSQNRSNSLDIGKKGKDSVNILQKSGPWANDQSKQEPSMSKKSVNPYPINQDITSPTFSINSRDELDSLEGHKETRSPETKPDENNVLYNDSGLVHVSSLTLTDIAIKRAHPKKKIVQKHNVSLIKPDIEKSEVKEDFKKRHNDNNEDYLNKRNEVSENVSKNSQKEKDNLKEVENQEDITYDELPEMSSKNMDFNRRLGVYSSLLDFDDHQGSNEKNIASTSYKSDSISFNYGRRTSWFDSKQNFPDNSYSSYKAKKFETDFGGNQNTKVGNVNLNDSELKQGCIGITYTLDNSTSIQSYSNIQAQYNNSLNFNSGTPLNSGLYSYNINEPYAPFPLAKDPHKTQNINILNSKTNLNINTQKAEKGFKRIDNSSLLSPERSHCFGIENGNLLSPERSNYFGMMPFENKLQMPIQHNLSSSLNKSPYNINRNEAPNILFGKINNGGNPFTPNSHYSFESDILGLDPINKPIKNSLPPFSQAFGSIIDSNRQFVPKENKGMENHLMQPQTNVNANIPLNYCMDSINSNKSFPPNLGYQYQNPPNNLGKVGPNITQNNVPFSDKAFSQDVHNKILFSDKTFNQEAFISNLIENPNSYEDHKANTYQSNIQNINYNFNFNTTVCLDNTADDPNNFIGPKNNIGLRQDAFSIPHKFQDDIQSSRGQFNDIYFSPDNRFGPNLDVSHIHNYDSSIMHQLDSTINPIDFQPQSFNPMRHNLNQPQPNLVRQNQIEVNNYPDQYMMGNSEAMGNGARNYTQNQPNEYIKRSNAPPFIPSLAHQKQFSNVLDRKNMKPFVDNNINGNMHLNDTDWNKINKDSKRNRYGINNIDIFNQGTLTPIKAIKELQSPTVSNDSKLQDKNAYFNSKFNDPNEKSKVGSQIGLEKDTTETNLGNSNRRNRHNVNGTNPIHDQKEKEKINKLEVETKSDISLSKSKQTHITLKRSEGTLSRDKAVSESQNTAKVISILQNPSKVAPVPQNTPKRITILQNTNKVAPISQSTAKVILSPSHQPAIQILKKPGPEAYTENKNGVEVAKKKENLIGTSAKGGVLYKAPLNKVNTKPLNKQESDIRKEGSNKTKASIPENKSDFDNEPKVKAASKKVAEMPVFQESPYTIIKPKNLDKEKKKEKENIVENEVKPPKVDKEIEVSHIDLVLDDYHDMLSAHLKGAHKTIDYPVLVKIVSDKINDVFNEFPIDMLDTEGMYHIFKLYYGDAVTRSNEEIDEALEDFLITKIDLIYFSEFKAYSELVKNPEQINIGALEGVVAYSFKEEKNCQEKIEKQSRNLLWDINMDPTKSLEPAL